MQEIFQNDLTLNTVALPPGEGGGEGLRPAGSARSCDALGVCQHRPGMGGACACESGFASTGAVTNADANAGAHAKASGAALPRGRRGAKAAGHTQAAAGAENALAGVLKAPADLWAFLQAVPVAEGARALGVSRRQVQRLLAGYWPGNAGALLAAWGAYKGRVAAAQSRWVLRCVSASGCVSYAGARWGAVQLLARCGQAVAVARVDAQRLLVQTLDLPGQRFELHGL